MKSYIATGENIDDLEGILEQHDIQLYRYKHIDAMRIDTEMEYETLQEICKDYTLTPQKEDIQTQQNDYDI